MTTVEKLDLRDKLAIAELKLTAANGYEAAEEYAKSILADAKTLREAGYRRVHRADEIQSQVEAVLKAAKPVAAK